MTWQSQRTDFATSANEHEGDHSVLACFQWFTEVLEVVIILFGSHRSDTILFSILIRRRGAKPVGFGRMLASHEIPERCSIRRRRKCRRVETRLKPKDAYR